MGKRQFRIFRKDILNHVPDLLVQPSVQVVQSNRVVMQGLVQSVNEERLELVDGRRHKHIVPMHLIEEIIYDKEAAF
jgi:hypothetical protein